MIGNGRYKFLYFYFLLILREYYLISYLINKTKKNTENNFFPNSKYNPTFKYCSK